MDSVVGGPIGLTLILHNSKKALSKGNVAVELDVDIFDNEP